jgi:hypothetical protein
MEPTYVAKHVLFPRFPISERSPHATGRQRLCVMGISRGCIVGISDLCHSWSSHGFLRSREPTQKLNSKSSATRQLSDALLRFSQPAWNNGKEFSCW